MIINFWGQKLVRMHEMGSNVARMTMQDGELVNQTYKRGTKDAHRTTFRQVMELFDQKPNQNAILTLRNVKEVMNRLALANRKSDVAIEADRTIRDEAEGAVAGADDDDDEEVSSGPVAKSKAGAKVQQREKCYTHVRKQASFYCQHVPGLEGVPGQPWI